MEAKEKKLKRHAKVRVCATHILIHMNPMELSVEMIVAVVKRPSVLIPRIEALRIRDVVVI